MSWNARRYHYSHSQRPQLCLASELAAEYGDTEHLDVLDQAIVWLVADGVEISFRFASLAALATMVAEAVNWAAKTINYGYYALKPELVDYAAAHAPRSGWGQDGAFYLWTPETGAVSFHDPGDEIGSAGEWPWPWHGISRQDTAFEVLAGNPELLRHLAILTTPAELS